MSNKTFIIAEAGVNHNGSFDIAMKLVDKAAEAGADAVKFQTFKPEKLVCVNTPKAAYQKITTGSEESQLDMLNKLALTGAHQKMLKSYCLEKNILFLSSPFDLDSIDYLNSIELEIFKIPSGEITNVPYLEKIGTLNKEVILSTGMSTIDEIGKALKIFFDAGTKFENITVLHCNTDYPTEMGDVNLNAMNTIKKEYGVKVGYSDHTVGIEVSIAAVALGACVIEKHFTLDRDMDGPDHKSSLTPSELKVMVKSIRNIEIAIGDGIKKPTDSELKNISAVRKSIVASKQINKGDLLSTDNITTKRPGTGLSPLYWNDAIGSIAIKNFNHDEFIEI